MSSTLLVSLLFCVVVVYAQRYPQVRHIPAPPQVDTLEAQCVLQPVDPESGPKGTVFLTQNVIGGPVAVRGQITGLSPGEHGFHVHANGDIGDSCKAAGGHFNPFNKTHGAPSDIDRHVGDLGNILADQSGVANIEITDTLICLNGGETRVIGRAVVLHAGVDDLGKGGNEESLKTGNAGKRLACCVIQFPQQ